MIPLAEDLATIDIVYPSQDLDKCTSDHVFGDSKARSLLDRLADELKKVDRNNRRTWLM